MMLDGLSTVAGMTCLAGVAYCVPSCSFFDAPLLAPRSLVAVVGIGWLALLE